MVSVLKEHLGEMGRKPKNKEIITEIKTTEVKPEKKSSDVVDKVINSLARDGFIVKRASDIKKVSKLKTEIFGFDWVIDGGFSICEGGHRIEIFGAESTAKTTLALYIIKKFQSLGKICGFIDGEKSFDPDWADIIGVNTKDLIMAKADTLEEAGNLYVKIIPQVDLLVTDSIVSLIPEGEAERETEEAQMALSARVNSLITRKIYHALGDKTPILIFINQLRDNVGKYGKPHTTAGGRALKHLYNTRVELKLGQPIMNGDERVGTELKLNCVKNKKGRPYHCAEIDFYYNGMIDNNKSLFYAGIKVGAITQEGHSYIFDDIKIVGKDNFINEFKEWGKLNDRIWERVK